jgi:hypothetical protein
MSGVKVGRVGTFRDVRMPYFEITKENVGIAEAAYAKTEVR